MKKSISNEDKIGVVSIEVSSGLKLTKAERIADYLGEPRDVIALLDLENNSRLLYGKFDPQNEDDIGCFIHKTKSGKACFHNPKLQKLAITIDRCHNVELLIQNISTIKPLFANKQHHRRIMFYLINMRLSELGIAPRWREMSKPKGRPKGAVWPEDESLYMLDLQVFDMEWMYRHYPSRRISSSYGGMYLKLMSGDYFNYSHAHIVAAANISAVKKAKSLMLTDDMQLEMMVLKSNKIRIASRKLDDDVEEVEIDLETAASRNRSRGDKLRAVIPNWLKLWKSAMMTPSASLPTMIDNYQKLTGIRLNRSTYNSKLKSLNKALAEVDSNHVLSI